MQFSLFRVVCFLYQLTLKTLSQFERKHIGSSPFFCFVPGIFCLFIVFGVFGVGVLGHRVWNTSPCQVILHDLVATGSWDG